MPIRFRCQHCQQLMGISRRKAGTEVRCPKCAQSVLVTSKDEVPATPAREHEAAKPAEPRRPGALFEHGDFDEVLRGTDELAPRIARPAPGGGLLEHKPPSREPEPARTGQPSLVSQMIPPNGIYISSRRATLLAVAGIVLLAVAFGAGLLVGRYCL